MGQRKRTGRYKYKLTDRFYFIILAFCKSRSLRHSGESRNPESLVNPEFRVALRLPGITIFYCFQESCKSLIYFLIHEAGGIDGVVVDAHLEVEVRAGCVSGQAYRSDDLSFDNFFSRSALDFCQVAVDG
jgi:hypothetical protein